MPLGLLEDFIMAVQNTINSRLVHRINISNADPVAIGLLAQTMVTITPNRNSRAVLNGQEFLFIQNETETVPQSIADLLKQAGVI